MTTFTGRQAVVAVKTDNTVAYSDATQTQSIDVNHDQPLTEVYILGDTDPQELKEGHIKIGGTIKRLFETGNFSAAGMTFFAMGTESGVKTSFYVGFFPEGDASPKILLSSVKFSNYKINAAVDGAVEESLDFSGLAMALS